MKLMLLAVGFLIVSITPAMKTNLALKAVPGAIAMSTCDASKCVYEGKLDGAFLDKKVQDR